MMAKYPDNHNAVQVGTDPIDGCRPRRAPHQPIAVVLVRAPKVPPPAASGAVVGKVGSIAGDRFAKNVAPIIVALASSDA